MTISLKADASGNSGAIQVAGVDRLTLTTDGSLVASADPATGARSRALATMQKFADEFEVSLNQNGYQKLPSGLIIQWGISASIADDQRITTTFPITFPNNCFVVVPASGASALGRSSFAEVHSISWTTSSVVFENLCNAGITTQARWLAIGY